MALVRRRRRIERFPKLSAAVLAAGLLVGASGCGKKGPPLAPLARVPGAPETLEAERRDADVTVRLTVPGRNTDGSSPADLTRVDLFALNGPATLTPAEVVRRGRVVTSVPVNPPPDEDALPDDPKPTVPGGIDQGAVAQVNETVAPSQEDEVRAYAAVGQTRRGRRGAVSSVAQVSLAAAPPPPAGLTTRYTDKAITIEWPASAETESSAGFHVYEAGEQERRLTSEPLGTTTFDDTRMDWGTERCYSVRAVAAAGALKIESAPSAPACVTLRDTFPPPAPTGLQTVPESGAVSLIWNAVDDPGLAGYLVLRAIAPATELTPVTPAPITETTFRDVVAGGQRVIYAVQAVDRAGNVSAASERREETPR